MGDEFTQNSSSVPPEQSGTSNPPDNGAVTTDDSLEQEAKGQSQQNNENVRASWGQSPVSAPTQPQAAQGQPKSQDQSAQKGRQPWNELSQIGAVPPPQPSKEQHPLVQKASIFRSVAETLAGGPRYQEHVDVNTGEMVRERVPMGRGDIAMAIALEAISGGLTGLSQTGPGGVGRGGAMAFQQQMGIKQQQRQEQDQQANADYARHMQVLETNMRMHQNAMTLGRMDFDSHKAHVDEYKDIADAVQKDYPDMIQDRVSESDLSKYHVTRDMAIPVGVSPTRDPQTGKQSLDKYGSPIWEEQYLVLKPDFKAQGFLSPADVTTLAEMGKTGFAKSDGSGPIDWPKNQAIAARLQLGLKAEAVAYRLAKQNVNDYYTTLNEAPAGGGGNFPTKTPELADANIQNIVDQKAKQYGIPVPIARGLVQQENPSNNPLAKSPKGALGIMQLIPGTAEQMGVKHPFNAAENIDGGMRYLKQLSSDPKFNGDWKLILAAYNAGPGNVTDHVPQNGETEKYVANISNAVGLGAAPQEGTNGQQFKPVDLGEAVKADRTLVKALEQFNPLLNATGGNYERAIGELGTKDKDAAGKIIELFGGQKAIQQYDVRKALLADKNKREQDNALDIAKKKQEAADKLAIDQKNSVDLKQMLRGPEGFKFSDDMYNMEESDLKQHLEDAGVQIPDNWDSLYAIATYHDSPSGYAPRVWTKGSPGEMDKQSALQYIHKYINRDYKETKYTAIAQNQKRFYDPDSKEGQTQMNAGTAAQHLEMVREAAHLMSQEPGASSIPFINSLAGQMGAEVGKTPYLTLQAILDKANDEVTKVAMGGGAAYREQIESGRKTMNAGNAEKQIDSIIEGYTKMMYGRLTSLDAGSFNITREHLPMMSEEANALFKKYKLPVPWADNEDAGGEIHPQRQPSGQGFAPRPGDNSQYPRVSRDGKIGIGPDGQRYDIGSGKLLGGLA